MFPRSQISPSHTHTRTHTHLTLSSRPTVHWLEITSSRCYITKAQALLVVSGNLLIKANQQALHTGTRARTHTHTRVSSHISCAVPANIIRTCQRASERPHDLNQLQQHEADGCPPGYLSPVRLRLTGSHIHWQNEPFREGNILFCAFASMSLTRDQKPPQWYTFEHKDKRNRHVWTVTWKHFAIGVSNTNMFVIPPQ